MINPIFTDNVTLSGDGTPVKPMQAQSGLRKAVVSISSAQILAMNVTPVVVIPAPGPGLVIVPITAYIVYNFKTTAYASAASNWLTTFNGNVGNLALSTQSINVVLTAGTSEVRQGFTQGSSILTFASCVNLPVTVSLSSAATLGDGTITFTIYYDVVPAA